jgi:hypothetical protein
MIPKIVLWVWIKASVEKFMIGGLIFYALRNKDNVAAKFGNGTFEIVATGDSDRKKLR